MLDFDLIDWLTPTQWERIREAEQRIADARYDGDPIELAHAQRLLADVQFEVWLESKWRELKLNA